MRVCVAHSGRPPFPVVHAARLHVSSRVRLRVRSLPRRGRSLSLTGGYAAEVRVGKMPSGLAALTFASALVAAAAIAPAPPHNLPPWAPGAAPPVPGPVFSKAFNALLVLLVVGCIFLGLNLRDALQKMRASDIGTDNEVSAQMCENQERRLIPARGQV